MQIADSISKFGTICIAIDYGTRFEDFLAVHAAYLIETGGELKLKSSLIGLMRTTGETKTSQNVRFFFE